MPSWLHFKPKFVGKRREIEKIKISIPFRSIPALHVTENSKKLAKKLKNTTIASFQAKIGWKMPRKRKNKNYRPVPFLHDA